MIFKLDYKGRFLNNDEKNNYSNYINQLTTSSEGLALHFKVYKNNCPRLIHSLCSGTQFLKLPSFCVISKFDGLDDQPYYDLVYTINKSSIHPEKQYLDALEKILTQGNRRTNSNENDYNIFGQTFEFDLNRLPLMTHKKINWYNCLADLLKMDLQQIVDIIKKDHESKKIIYENMQFFISNDKLDCYYYEESAEMIEEVPKRIFKYSVLTLMLVQVLKLNPGRFIWTGGDCHIFENDIPTYLGGIDPTPQPLLVINSKIESINDFTIKDFVMVGYFPNRFT